MYGYRNAPQVTFARKPVKVQSVWERYGFKNPARSAKGEKTPLVSFVPA